MSSFLIKSKASGWAVGIIMMRSFFFGIVIPEIIFAAKGDSIESMSLVNKVLLFGLAFP